MITKALVDLPGFRMVKADNFNDIEHTIVMLITTVNPGPWRIVDVVGDGSCFYYTVNIAYFITTGQAFVSENIDRMREACVSWIIAHADTPIILPDELRWPSLRVYIEEENDGMDLDTFCTRQLQTTMDGENRKIGEYATFPMIIAASGVLRVKIDLVAPDGIYKIVAPGVSREASQLFLAFESVNRHYKTLIPRAISETSVVPPNTSTDARTLTYPMEQQQQQQQKEKEQEEEKEGEDQEEETKRTRSKGRGGNNTEFNCRSTLSAGTRPFVPASRARTAGGAAGNDGDGNNRWKRSEVGRDRSQDLRFANWNVRGLGDPKSGGMNWMSRHQDLLEDMQMNN